MAAPTTIGRVFPPTSLALGVCGLAAILYLIAFYQRVAPAVMTRELMSDFGLTAAALGNLSAFYFYSYVAMQIPTGILADRWGPRRLLSAGAGVAAAGTLIFALAPNLFWANTGRLLIGGSVAVSFVAVLKLATHWFSPRRFALASGMLMFFGIIGAVFAGVPLRLLIDEFGWRSVIVASALATALAAASIWRFVRDDPEEKGYVSYFPGGLHSEAKTPVFVGLREVFRYRNTWLLFLAPGGIVGPVLTFTGLWGVPFLTTHYGMSQTEAAAATSTMMVAWAVGGPLFGAASDRVGRRKPLYLAGCIVLIAGWVMLIFVARLPQLVLYALFIAVGFCTGTIAIGFAYVKEAVPPRLGGTATGVCNMGVMLGPMLLQPAVGWMLDRHWAGAVHEGARLYDIEAYRAGFTLMLAWVVLCLILVAATRETHCRQH
ncbi:MAG TPA: MFS transporter [Burkholderiales bacterium]|nr:MFS transporter [Burkholderiales bacterium]